MFVSNCFAQKVLGVMIMPLGIVKVDHKCFYPFNPSSIVTVLLFKKKGLQYITTDGEERCAWHFAKEIEATINEAIFITDNYKQELLKEIKQAKLKRSNI